ncbi:MAG: hypothetical protein A3Q59_06760 [Methanomethylophilus alvi]|nr:MAG: hypothetical protein A3Q59_06760 [Methanomethylophilus alvi]
MRYAGPVRTMMKNKSICGGRMLSAIAAIAVAAALLVPLPLIIQRVPARLKYKRGTTMEASNIL